MSSLCSVSTILFSSVLLSIINWLSTKYNWRIFSLIIVLALHMSAICSKLRELGIAILCLMGILISCVLVPLSRSAARFFWYKFTDCNCPLNKLRYVWLSSWTFTDSKTALCCDCKSINATNFNVNSGRHSSACFLRGTTSRHFRLSSKFVGNRYMCTSWP